MLRYKIQFTQCQKFLDVCPCILPGGSDLVFDIGVGCRFPEFFSCRKLKFYLWFFLTGHVVDEGYYCIARLCHIGHGFLKFSLIYLNSVRKVCGNVM